MKIFQVLVDSISSYERVCQKYMEDVSPDDGSLLSEIWDVEPICIDGRLAFKIPEDLAIIDDVITYKGEEYYSPPFYLIIPGPTDDQ